MIYINFGEISGSFSNFCERAAFFAFSFLHSFNTFSVLSLLPSVTTLYINWENIKTSFPKVSYVRSLKIMISGQEAWNGTASAGVCLCRYYCKIRWIMLAVLFKGIQSLNSTGTCNTLVGTRQIYGNLKNLPIINWALATQFVHSFCSWNDVRNLTV